MAESQETPKTKSAPTEKMVLAATGAAARHDVKPPKGFEQDFDVCKAFLDAYLNKASPKAVKFAESIAKEKGLTIPDEARLTGKSLSAWIDENN